MGTKYTATNSQYRKNGGSWWAPFSGGNVAQGYVDSASDYESRHDFDWTTIRNKNIDYIPTDVKLWVYRTDSNNAAGRTNYAKTTDASGNVLVSNGASAITRGAWFSITMSASMITSLVTNAEYVFFTFSGTAYSYVEIGAYNSASYKPYLEITWVIRNTAPSQPTSFTASPAVYKSGNIALNWSGATDDDGNISGYEWQYATSDDGGSTWSAWSASTTVTTTSGSGSTTFAWGSTVEGRKIKFQIRTKDAGGLYSSWYPCSNILMRNIIPAEPLNVSPLSAITQEGSYTVTWGAVSHSDAGQSITYEVSRGEWDGSAYVWTVIGSPSTNSFADTGLAAAVTRGTRVAYRVRAYDGQEYSGYTQSTSYLTYNRLPNNMSGVTVNKTIMKPADTVRVSFTNNGDPDNNMSGTQVLMQYVGGASDGLWFTGGTPSSNVASAQVMGSGSAAATYIDVVASTWTRGLTWKFFVRGYDTLGQYSTPVAASQNVKVNSLPTIGDIATPNDNGYYEASIDLSWPAAADVDGQSITYRVERLERTSPTTFVLTTLASGLTVRAHTDNIAGIARGRTLEYYIWVNDGLEESEVSAYTGTLMRNRLPLVPSAFTSLTADKTSAVNENLTWSPVTSDPDNHWLRYEVEVEVDRSGVWTSFSNISVMSTGSVVIPNAGYAQGTERRFRMRSVDSAGGVSAYIYSAYLTRNTIPTTPATSSPEPAAVADRYFNASIALLWAAVTDVDSQSLTYCVERGIWNGSAYTYTQIASGLTSPNYTDNISGLAQGQQIIYRFRAYDGQEYGNYRTLAYALFKEHAPDAPVINFPVVGSTVYNRNPRILVTTGDQTDSLTQKVSVSVDNGSSYVDCINTPAQFAADGWRPAASEQNGYQPLATLPAGAVNAKLKTSSKSGGTESAIASRAFTIVEKVWTGTIAADQTFVDAVQVNELRTVVDNLRTAYGLDPIAWLDANPLVNRVHRINPLHLEQIGQGLQDVADKINAWVGSADLDISVPTVTGVAVQGKRPSAQYVRLLRTFASQI